tara:strand:- start:508 stop:852 length:345 start_codon:yes stop_codon:yes gene_type:complete
MKKITSLIIMLAFLLGGCYASFQPATVSVVRKPAYVYYDHIYGTNIYLPYRISPTSRYTFVRYVRNYRGKYKTYTRYYLKGRKTIRKIKNHRKRHPPAAKKRSKKQKKNKPRKH